MERKLEQVFPGQAQDIPPTNRSPFAFNSDPSASDRSIESSPDSLASLFAVPVPPAPTGHSFGSDELARLFARLEAEKSNAAEPRMPLATVGMPLPQSSLFNHWNNMSFPGGLSGLPSWPAGANKNAATPPLQPPKPTSSGPTSEPGWTPWQSRNFLQDAALPLRLNLAPLKFGATSLPPPPRSVFEFPTASPQDQNLKPTLRIFPNRIVNVVNSQVSFVIQCLNFPKAVELKEDMFEIIVENPSQVRIPSHVRHTDTFPAGSFLGDFAAGDKPGYYDVKVRLVLPMAMCSVAAAVDFATSGVLTESCAVPVSRNYIKDAESESLLIQCEFQAPDPAMMRSPGPLPSHFTPPPCKLWGLACDFQTNNLFYTDRTSNEVICVSPRGDILLRFGRKSASEREWLHRPTGIACDNVNKRLIISDKDNHRISFFTLDGQFIAAVGGRGHLDGLFHYPWDVACSSNGDHIVVADSRNKRIQLLDRFGNFINKFSVYEKNPFDYKHYFDYPRGVCFDENDKNIYVTDFNQHNILQFPLDLSHMRKLVPDGKLRRPQGLTVDQIGNLLVVDARNNCVRHVSKNGDLLATIRDIKSSVMNFPVNICTMAGGYVAVLDGTGKIHIF